MNMFRHTSGDKWEGLRQREQPLLTWMGHPIQREQRVEVAGEHGRGAVIEANQIAPRGSPPELSRVGVESTAQDCVVVPYDCLGERLGVRLTRPPLKRFKPARPIIKRLGNEHVMPDRRRIAERRFETLQNPRDALFYPGPGTESHVSLQGPFGFEPLVTRLPEPVV